MKTTLVGAPPSQMGSPEAQPPKTILTVFPDCSHQVTLTIKSHLAGSLLAPQASIIPGSAQIEKLTLTKLRQEEHILGHLGQRNIEQSTQNPVIRRHKKHQINQITQRRKQQPSLLVMIILIPQTCQRVYTQQIILAAG